MIQLTLLLVLMSILLSLYNMNSSMLLFGILTTVNIGGIYINVWVTNSYTLTYTTLFLICSINILVMSVCIKYKNTIERI